MKVSELQVILESIVGDHGDHVEVRVAIQPSWPFEHEIGNVSAVESEGKTVLYIGYFFRVAKSIIFCRVNTFI